MSSFISALGGLRANQSWIDVIGNNLANTNTPGFKASRALFADLLSVTLKSGTAPGGGLGGTNPMQIGLGVQFSHVEKLLSQGALNLTGRTFDVAMLGQGFFAVDNGSETLYTRVGSFGLDAEGNMVDQRTGYPVLGASGQPFSIDTSAVFPPQGTSEASFKGNLPATITGPLAEVLSTVMPLAEGAPATTTGSVAGPFDVPVGETWTMELIVNGGAPQQVQIVGAGSLTAADVASQIEAQTDHLSVTVASGGELVLTSDKSGEASTIAVNPGAAGQDLKALFGFVDFVQGSQAVATASTDLNALSSNLADYQPGDAITVNGTDADGAQISASFEYGVDGTTVGDLVAFLDQEFQGAEVAFNGTTGQIEITASEPGESELSIALGDGAGQVGSGDWGEHAFAVTTNGAGPDTVKTSVEVFDSTGTSHVLATTLTRQEDGSWNLAVSVPAEEGTVVQGEIQGITFNADGSLQTPSTGDLVLAFGSLGDQTITLDLGTAGQFEGLTQFGGDASVVADFQDGYAAGQLVTMSVEGSGVIQGFYTNGQTQELGAFGVATFANEQGLMDAGDSYVRASPNSGSRVFGAAQTGIAGDVVGGALEGSNVDTAEQFVHMIEAQRGFQANARVITVQDELLSEIVNVV